MRNAKSWKEKQIKNDQKQTSKDPLNQTPEEKSATPKKKPLRYLRKFRYPPIYKNWWNSDLFDVTLKRTGKQY